MQPNQDTHEASASEDLTLDTPELEERFLEIIATRHHTQFGVPICPQPNPQENDAFSSPWEITDCRFNNGYLQIVWMRNTTQPQRYSDPMDNPSASPAAPAAPPPTSFGVAATYEDQQSGIVAPELDQVLEQQAADLANGIPAAPPPVAPSLPGYARARLPLATQQNIARARGGIDVPAAPPMVAPAYQAPVPVAGVPGLPGATLATEVAVKPCSAPIPPLPTPGGEPPLARTGAQTTAVQPTVAVSAPAGRSQSQPAPAVSNEVSMPRAAIVPGAVAGVKPTSAAQPAGPESVSAPAMDTRPRVHVSTMPQKPARIPRQTRIPVIAPVPVADPSPLPPPEEEAPALAP